MALTQSEWFDKLKSFVPGWRFSSDSAPTIAVFQAVAAVLAAVEEDSEDQFNATFLTRSVTPVLDLLGNERSIPRIPDEPPALYVARMQQITSHTNKPDIAAMIDSLLIIPGVKILEAPVDSPYCSRGTFCSRDTYLMELRQNYFIAVIPKQTHDPYSFLSRSNFCSRSNFIGSLDVTSTAYTTIIAAVNALKALGVMWGLVEAS
jgi:hypothetical protein